MKIVVVMIVFNGDFVLEQALEQVYPHVSQILISEGCVKYWIDRGYTTSTDNTNDILNSFPDPANKIQIVHGIYKEKTEQANAVMHLVNDDTDYIWVIDSDECYKTEDIINLKDYLEEIQPDSVAIRSCTFFGGFDNYLTGFEQLPNNFRRIFKYEKGAVWAEHRPPKLTCERSDPKHVDGDWLFDFLNIQMYHYSYVSPDMVYQKMQYYAGSVNPKNIIPNYFENVWLPWVTGDDDERVDIEYKNNGAHEFLRRPYCFTKEFIGTHPESIVRDLKSLENKFWKQLSKYTELQ